MSVVIKEVSRFTRNWEDTECDGTITVAYCGQGVNHAVTIVREEGAIKCSFDDNKTAETQNAIKAIFDKLDIDMSRVSYCSGKELNGSFLSILHGK